ncbi:MAG: hypothetical protein RI897_3656 [Verrucomicrobiota bacterium]
MGADFIALGDGDFAHIIAQAGELGALPVVPGGGGAGPCADGGLDVGIFPETDDHLSVETESAHDEPVLAVAMGGLVQVHEVHINAGPGDIPVMLGVEVEDGFFEVLEALDPHLGGRERVHPGDDADAVFTGIGFEAELSDGVGSGQDGLEFNLEGDMG